MNFLDCCVKFSFPTWGTVFCNVSHLIMNFNKMVATKKRRRWKKCEGEKIEEYPKRTSSEEKYWRAIKYHSGVFFSPILSFFHNRLLSPSNNIVFWRRKGKKKINLSFRVSNSIRVRQLVYSFFFFACYLDIKFFLQYTFFSVFLILHYAWLNLVTLTNCFEKMRRWPAVGC